MSFIGEIHRLVADYGYLAVSLGILLEDFGMPTPGETLLISGAVLASQGALDIRWLLLLAWIGAVIGDNIGFAIGHYGGHRFMLRYGARLGITSERFAAVERFFDRYGSAVILFARFVVLLRQFNGIVAGTLEMHWARFLIFNAIGAALWVGFWGMLAFWLGKRVFPLLREVGRIEPLLIGLAILAAILAAAYIFWRRRPARKNAAGPG